HATGAGSCILFEMPQGAREVRVLTNTGSPLTNYNATKYMLKATPIEEVIRQGAHLFEKDVSHNLKFQHLKIFDFACCIGVPVRSFGQPEYGLFLFHRRKHHFTHEHLSQASVAAALIGALLARKEAEQIMRRVQPFVFAGQIGSTLMHELNG